MPTAWPRSSPRSTPDARRGTFIPNERPDGAAKGLGRPLMHGLLYMLKLYTDRLGQSLPGHARRPPAVADPFALVSELSNDAGLDEVFRKRAAHRDRMLRQIRCQITTLQRRPQPRFMPLLKTKRPMRCALPQASIATTQDGSPSRKASRRCRWRRLRKTTASASSSPARLQTVLPRSMPKTIMSIRCSSLHPCPQQ